MDELAGGRYRLGDVVARRPHGALRHATDGRLGRAVLVQYDDGVAFPHGATRLLAAEHPGVARVLDAGEDLLPDGTRRSYVVYPTSDWSAATFVPVGQWIAPACAAVRRVSGVTVAPCTEDVLVDIHPVAVSEHRESWRVQWLPSPAAIADITSHRALVGTVPTSHRREVA